MVTGINGVMGASPVLTMYLVVVLEVVLLLSVLFPISILLMLFTLGIRRRFVGLLAEASSFLDDILLVYMG